jgi:hypothetical protein
MFKRVAFAVLICAKIELIWSRLQLVYFGQCCRSSIKIGMLAVKEAKTLSQATLEKTR